MVSGNGGNDVIDLSEVTVPLFVTVDAGAGNDTVIGSANSNRIFGGGGRDRIDGRGGNDLVDGGRGRDGVVGGAGVGRFSFNEEISERPEFPPGTPGTSSFLFDPVI